MSDPAIEAFDLESQTGWTLAEATIDGRPALVRFRQDLDLFIGRARWSRRLTIGWVYEGDEQSGMPTDAITDTMRVFEDALVPALEHDKLGILTFVFTCDGVRHWHFYVSEPEQLGDRVNTALAGKPEFPISLTVEDDPEWGAYRQILRGAGIEDQGPMR